MVDRTVARLLVFRSLSSEPCAPVWSRSLGFDLVSLRALPLAVEPEAGHDEVVSLGIALFRMAENLPWAPWVFLIPEPGNVQVRNRAIV